MTTKIKNKIILITIFIGMITLFILIQQNMQDGKLLATDDDSGTFKNAEKKYNSKVEKKLNTKDVANPLSEICQQEISKYQNIAIEINELYPIGTDISILISDLEHDFGKPLKVYQTIDYFFVNSNYQTEVNSWVYGFMKECNLTLETKVQWTVVALTDLSKKITVINVRPLIQTADFSLTKLSFNFDYFHNKKDIKKALWSLTGTNTTKSKVLELMSSIDNGYGDLRIIEKVEKNELSYQYEYTQTKFIPIRIFPNEFDSTVIWKFDSEDRVIDLIVH